MNRSGFALNIAWTDNFQPNAKITRCVCNITMTPRMIYMYIHREVILMNAFGTFVVLYTLKFISNYTIQDLTTCSLHFQIMDPLRTKKESYIKVHLYIQFSLCFCKPESCALKNCMIPYPPSPTQSMVYPLTPTHVQKHVKYSVVLKV